MSERPADSRPYGSAAAPAPSIHGNEASRPSTAHRTTATGARDASRRISGASSSFSPVSHRQSAGRPFELPPLPHLTSTCGPPRSAGITSIFNSLQDDETKPNRRRKASEIESPTSPGPSLPPLASTTVDAQMRTNAPRESSFVTSTDPAARRILTPRSPSSSLRHTSSFSQLAPATGTSSVQDSPFVTSPQARGFAAEPANTGVAPSLPTPTASYRGGFGFPAPSPAQSRRASIGTGRTGRRPSSSASPSTSYSSYSQTSPPTQHPLSFPAGYQSHNDPRSYEPTSAGFQGFPGGNERLRPASIPITSSSGPNSYQLMTYETSSGAIQLPVDMHAASRAADEKRRRNAGASARFRQRRKEKEKEASTMISRLEQQVKELGEEAEYYKRERDYLAGVVLQVPGGERHFPRPPSPGSRRGRGSSSSVRAAVAGPSNYQTVQHQQQQEGRARSPDEDESIQVRRRRTTSAMSLPPPPPPQADATAQVPVQQQGGPGAQHALSYAPQPYSTPLLPHREAPPIHQQAPYGQPTARPPLPPAPTGAHQQQQLQHPPQGYRESATMQPPPGPQHLMQAPPQTGPWNPFAANKRHSGPPPGPPR